jgi:hypothetical protein
VTVDVIVVEMLLSGATPRVPFVVTVRVIGLSFQSNDWTRIS